MNLSPIPFRVWLALSLLLGLLLLPLNGSSTEVIEDEGDEDVVEQQVTETKATPPKTKEDIEATYTEESASPFHILGVTIEPGTKQTVRWLSGQSPLGTPVENVALIVNGNKPGPVLGLIAAIHGDELNGIEIIRQVVHDLDPGKIRGTVVAVPIVNLEGFVKKERYLGDRRDLNRYFPGNQNGSHTSRVAHLLFSQIIQHCDLIVDLHTGSFFRENLPQLRVDLTVDGMTELVEGFGAMTALHSVAPSGSLRGAATAAGIPAIVVEVGGPLSLEMDKVGEGVKSLQSFIQTIGITPKRGFKRAPQPLFYESGWLRAESGGIFISKVELGDQVKVNQVLAEVSNPVTNQTVQIKANVDGTILGRAQNQFVSPGFGLFHIGHKKTVEEIEEKVKEESKAEES